MSKTLMEKRMALLEMLIGDHTDKEIIQCAHQVLQLPIIVMDITLNIIATVGTENLDYPEWQNGIENGSCDLDFCCAF